MLQKKANRSSRSSPGRRVARTSSRLHPPSTTTGRPSPVGNAQKGYRNGFDRGFKIGYAEGYEAGLAEDHLNV